MKTQVADQFQRPNLAVGLVDEEKPVSVLFIEDDPQISEMFRLKLETDGYEVTIAGSDDGIPPQAREVLVHRWIPRSSAGPHEHPVCRGTIPHRAVLEDVAERADDRFGVLGTQIQNRQPISRDTALVQTVVILGEHPALLEIVGGAIILVGVRVATLRFRPEAPLEEAAPA